jgi:chaperonin GroEL
MAKRIITGTEAHNAILRGFNIVADVVGATLGPRSGTVILGRPYGAALVTKDGVTVAESISIADPFENEGAKLIQEAARKTNQEAGDGTTAATILTRAIFREGVKVVAAGANAMAVERGIQKGVAAVVAALAELSQPVDQSDLDAIRKVATISANSDAEMGDVIARAVHKVGLEGVVMVNTSPTLETTLEISQGLRFDRGFVAPQFMEDGARGVTIFESCNIFITDRRLIDGNQMGQFLQNYVRDCGQVPLLIIAEDIAEGALQLLVVNNGRSCKVVPVKTPGSGATKKEEMEDIAIWTGARAYTVAAGHDWQKVGKEDYGSADRVIVSPRTTTIVGGHGQTLRIETRKDEIRSRLADPEAKDFEKAQLERRLALLASSVAVIKIGSSVHSKLLEKRDRVEDSVNATKAALKEGIVPGGGVALIRCLPALEGTIAAMDDAEEKVGAQIVAKALTQPLHRLATNAGKSGDVIVGKVIAGHPLMDENGKFSIGGHAGKFVPEDGRVYIQGVGPAYSDPRHYGYNAATDRFEFLVDSGIIDPTKVVRLALQNSAELAGLLLTSAALVVDIPEPQKAADARP